MLSELSKHTQIALVNLSMSLKNTTSKKLPKKYWKLYDSSD